MGDLKIVVAGCVAQQEGAALLRRVPEVDLVMGPQYANRSELVPLKAATLSARKLFVQPTRKRLGISRTHQCATHNNCSRTDIVPVIFSASSISRQGFFCCTETDFGCPCRISELLEQVDAGSQVVATDPISIVEDVTVPRRDSTITAWVNVIYGCNERCTYCVVPNTRGEEQSREPYAIMVCAECSHCRPEPVCAHASDLQPDRSTSASPRGNL